MFQRLRSKILNLRSHPTTVRIRAAFKWMRGTCPFCLSLGRVVAEPDAPPTERYYIPCQVCQIYMPQNVTAWEERQKQYDVEDLCARFSHEKGRDLTPREIDCITDHVHDGSSRSYNQLRQKLDQDF